MQSKASDSALEHTNTLFACLLLSESHCNVWALVYGLCNYLDDSGHTLLLHSQACVPAAGGHRGTDMQIVRSQDIPLSGISWYIHHIYSNSVMKKRSISTLAWIWSLQ